VPIVQQQIPAVNVPVNAESSAANALLAIARNDEPPNLQEQPGQQVLMMF
jgi:hypothetical protein